MVDYSITELDISDEGLTELPDDIDKYTNLKFLECQFNNITSLDNLPQKLEVLNCSYNNNITSLDNLPPTLKILDCNNNQLNSLDNLQPNLEILYCGYNRLTSLDNLPPKLEVLYCGTNQITSLDNLPQTLTELNCNNNLLKYDFEPTLENIKNYNASRILSS